MSTDAIASNCGFVHVLVFGLLTLVGIILLGWVTYNCIKMYQYNCINDPQKQIEQTHPAVNELSFEHDQNRLAESINIDSQVQSEAVQNLNFQQSENQEVNDVPTFDEALEMEIVNVETSETELRRRLSSRLSIKNDELPDYENYENHPVYNL